MTTAPAVVAAALAVLLLGMRARPVARSRRTVAARRRRLALPCRSRRGAPGEVTAAAFCEAAARSLRAGSTLTAALTEAAGEQQGFEPAVARVLDAVTRGRALADVLAEVDVDPATAEGLVLGVLHSCASLGGPAAAPLERVATTLRTRAAIAEEHAAHSAQARLSAKVLTLVPVALLALLAVTEANVRGALATGPGFAVVATGAVLNVAGWRWMQHVIGTGAS